MKKIILSILFSAAAVVGMAQTGFKAGVGMATMDLPANGVAKMKTNFAVGLVQQIRLAPRVGLQIEQMYITKGYDSKQSLIYPNVQLEYLAVPVLATVKVPGGLRILAGPEFSYLLKENAPGELNKFDVGLAGALGFQISKIGFDVRYTHGMNKVYKNLNYVDGQGSIKSEEGGKNQVFMFSAYVVL